MTQDQIKNRIEQINQEISKILNSEDASVEAAAKWANLQNERSKLKNLIN